MSGERLLAHELAHTIQQDGSGSGLQRQILARGEVNEASRARGRPIAMSVAILGSSTLQAPRPHERSATCFETAERASQGARPRSASSIILALSFFGLSSSKRW
jgi:hypothetical protein